jgi:nucleotide-binding universal stress UspA family protein
MIVSASYRTDIPAFHARWFMTRLEAGYCEVRNPYGGKASRVSLLQGDVDGIAFWSRNMAPLLASLDIVRAKYPFTVSFTATAYPRALEAATVPAERAVAQMAELATRFGKRAVVWRYDPIVITSLTDAAWHRANFTRLANALRGVVDEAVVSFMQPYRKSARNLDIAAREHRFTWRDPSDEEKRALLGDLAAVARDHGMKLTLCAQPHLLIDGVMAARCIDVQRLSDIAGRDIAAPTKGNRDGCACAQSRDIGAYDSCAQGCAYCYAVTSPQAAQKKIATLDANAAMLG